MSSELSPALEPFRETWRSRMAALACATVGGLGVAGLVLYSLVRFETLVLMPSLWLTIPLCVVTVGLAIASLVRREQAHRTIAGGVLLAAATVFLGWVVIAVVVVLIGWLAAHAIGEAL